MKLIRTQGRNATGAAIRLAALERRGGAALDSVLPVVKRIVAQVRRSGDGALFCFAAEFDGLNDPGRFRISAQEMLDAWEAIDPALRDAIKTAAKQIRTFAQQQMPKSWTKSSGEGLNVGQLVRPLGSVGCYVPSGRHPLPSSLLMTAIPAQVAGVQRIVAVSPRPALETLAAAHLLGIKEFYRVGGAHAIAALAYGTRSLPRVDKIVGPGNLYVTAAKRLVAFDCAIDMLAGPTEIVVTTERGNPAEVAADLVAQAEHDPEALAVFVTTREDLAANVVFQVREQSRNNAVARDALGRNGVVIVAGTLEEAHAITNRLAPEHLTVDSAEDVDWVTSAGSVFVGRWSAQPMGDYISGPNHTLPTGGMARVRGGLSVNDFIKLITVQQYSAEGIERLGPQAALLADAEGLSAHGAAIRLRVTRSGRKPSRRTARARRVRA